MPQHNEAHSHLVSEWLRKADEDAALVERLAADPTGVANPIAFHAQQAVEK